MRHRDPRLDAIRCVAILLVLSRHAPIEPRYAGRLRFVAEPLNRFGWTGVDLFFVLSGYLIGGLLFREIAGRGALDARRFFVRRQGKILPSYVAFLLVAPLVFAREWGLARPPYTMFRWNWAFWQNYRGSPANHTWSLAVEEHFYLALPLLLLILPRRREGDRVVAIPGIPRLALGAMIGCTAMRIAMLGRPGAADYCLAATHLRIDGLMCGVWLAYLAAFSPATLGRLASRRALVPASLALLLPMARLDQGHPFVYTAGFALLYLGYAGLVVAAVHRPRGEPSVALRFAAWAGAFSYPIYLWHAQAALWPTRDVVVPALAGMGLGPEAVWALAQLAYAGLALAMGIATAVLIERPALGLRDRLFPPRA